ncbi:MAG TPA: carbohydrate binding domain-containing protein [Thermoguttaceae bacterium]|nr:carbohydrate binding domain-containing protein [Thermoguttaceae bacterium]
MRTAGSLLAAVVACALAGAGEPGTNLIENPGFEAGADAPTGWTFNGRNTDSQIACDSGRAHGGRRAVRITNATKAETGNVVQSVRLDPPLEPGSLVTFSAVAATEDLRRDGARIVVYLERASGGRETAVAAGPGGTRDFAEVRGQARVGHRTSRLVVYLCNYGTGTVWWDDASVTVRRAAAEEIVARPKGQKRLPPLRTGDGLSLALSDSGGVDDVLLDGRSAASASLPSGLWLEPFEGAAVPVVGQLAARDGSIVQRWADDDVGLRVDATYRAGADVMRCDGSVEDLTGRERGVDVVFSLPVGNGAWRWGQSIREEVPVGDELQVQDETTFSSLSAPDHGDAVALAVPADCPSDCEFTYGGRLAYAVRFHFGLSHAADGELKGRAPFSFVVYRCDGRWGLRDAARRYYELWPEAFRKRVAREGLWMFGSPRFPLPDAENYAFHEGGPAGWEDDDAHGIYTCPYIIPGQREISRVERLPETQEEAMEVFRSLAPAGDEASSDIPGQSLAAGTAAHDRDDRGWGPSMKAIIENCMLLDADGRPHMRIRNTEWGGNSITFPLDASPRLLAESDRPTVAKTLLAHSMGLLDAVPSLDGIYVDSLGAWGSYLNHRREHFAASRVPLSYDPNTGRPVIPNRFTLLEFLWELGDKLHARDKLLFANGVHPDRRFHFFALDVMGVEGHGRMEQKRVMAYRKPFLLLIYNIHDDAAKMEHYYHLATLYGIYPSFANMRVYETPEMYAPVRALNDRFVPALRAITRAGWQPIPHAWASDPDVWLERWGPGSDGEVYLTAYNSAGEERTTTLTVDAASLDLAGATLRLDDRLSSAQWNAPFDGGSCTASVTIPAEQVRVLRLSGE